MQGDIPSQTTALWCRNSDKRPKYGLKDVDYVERAKMSWFPTSFDQRRVAYRKKGFWSNPLKGAEHVRNMGHRNAPERSPGRSCLAVFLGCSIAALAVIQAAPAAAQFVPLNPIPLLPPTAPSVTPPLLPPSLPPHPLAIPNPTPTPSPENDCGNGVRVPSGSQCPPMRPRM